MEEKKIRYKVFKISYNILWYQQTYSSKVYAINYQWESVFLSFYYSFLTILVGFWGKRFLESVEAIHVNFSGGEDYSKTIDEGKYEDIVNEIYDNLSRSTSNRLNKQHIEDLLDIQNEFMERYSMDTFEAKNVEFLKKTNGL